MHQEIIRRWADQRITRATLWVFVKNERAVRFYEKLGWLPTGRRRQSSFAPHPTLAEYTMAIS